MFRTASDRIFALHDSCPHKQGKLSHGMLEWGGSIFTNALLGLQRSKVADFDKNCNQLVEWHEFFPSWQEGTSAAGQRVSRGKLNQVPEANRLAP